MQGESLITRRNMLRASGTIAGIIAMGTVLGACSTTNGESAKATTSKANAVKLSIGHHGVARELPFYVGSELGFFKDAGIDAQLVDLTKEADSALTSESVDCFMITPADYLALNEKRTYAIVDSLHYGGQKAVASEASEINGVKDLETHLVAVYPGDFVQTTLCALMRREGRNPDTVQWAPTEYTTMEPVLKGEVVGAVAADNPWPDIVLSRVPGSKTIFSWGEDEALKDTLFGFAAIKTAVIQSQPDIAKMFSTGLKAAIEWIGGNPEDACSLVVDAGYVRVGTDAGYTKDLMVQEVKQTRFASGDKGAIDKSFSDIWTLISQGSPNENVPTNEDALKDFIESLRPVLINAQFA